MHTRFARRMATPLRSEPVSCLTTLYHISCNLRAEVPKIKNFLLYEFAVWCTDRTRYLAKCKPDGTLGQNKYDYCIKTKIRNDTIILTNYLNWNIVLLLQYGTLIKVKTICGQHMLLFCPNKGGIDCSMFKKSGQKKTFLCIALAAMFVLLHFAGSIQASAAEFEPPADLTGESSGTALPESPEPPALTDEELRAYFGNSVFIGDSIMAGFRNYSAKQETYVHDISFLAEVSYGVRNALKPLDKSRTHPKYNGEKYLVWDAVPLTGCQRAFIMLGINDIGIWGPEKTRDKYKELIDKILEVSPELEIHIISITYTLEGAGKDALNNTNIAAYNTLLQEMAEENGWRYLDLCTVISDGNGNLAEDCCGDKFVHLTSTAYALWETELIHYAGSALSAKETETPAIDTAEGTGQPPAADTAESAGQMPAADTAEGAGQTPATDTTTGP